VLRSSIQTGVVVGGRRRLDIGCVSTDVGTWTNWLTFEPDLDHSPDAGTGLLSPISYRLRNFAAMPRQARLPTSCTATRNFTSGKSHVYVLAERRWSEPWF